MRGRPLKFTSVEEMQAQIEAYFEECDERKMPYTVSGLARALNTNRMTLHNYGKKEEFSDVIEDAKARIEQSLEENMLLGRYNAATAIFNLKNNYGWRDQTEIKNTHEGSMDVRSVVINGVKARDA